MLQFTQYNSDRLAASLPSPTNLMVSPTSPSTSITLTWKQPEGADAVHGYEINYCYNVIECLRDGDTRPFPSVTVFINNGSLRSYTIMNSPTTPVEEDSQYTISITAVNSVAQSGPSNTAFTTTADAGLILLWTTNKCITNNLSSIHYWCHPQLLDLFNLSESVLLTSPTSQFSGTVLTVSSVMEALMATELSTFLLLIHIIVDMPGHQVLVILTEYSLSLDCLHGLATCTHFKFRLTILSFVYVVKSL